MVNPAIYYLSGTLPDIRRLSPALHGAVCLVTVVCVVSGICLLEKLVFDSRLRHLLFQTVVVAQAIQLFHMLNV